MKNIRDYLDWISEIIMKRMKRFVLGQSDEKDPMWKSSDNLLAGRARITTENKLVGNARKSADNLFAGSSRNNFDNKRNDTANLSTTNQLQLPTTGLS